MITAMHMVWIRKNTYSDKTCKSHPADSDITYHNIHY